MLLFLAACTEPDEPADKAPGEPIIAITPASPTTLDDLTVTVQGGAADPEGDAVTFAYAWFVDGADAGITGTTVSADLTTRDETWRVVVTPSDGELDGVAAVAEVGIANSAPTATLSLDPLAPTTADEVTATASGADADGDAVTFTWEWTRDGVPAGLTEPTLPAGVHQRGEAWAVVATPSDGTLAGAPATAAFTVGNALPTLGAVAIAPEGATTVDTLSALVTGAADADGDAVVVTVEWWVDDALVATEEVDESTASTLTGLAGRGDRVRVVATPFDGFDHGEPVESAELEIANALPSATGATILPNPLTTADAVTCVGAGWADPDGDAEGWLVSWTINGVEVSTDPTLPAGTARRGDVVGCSLVPFDGFDAGAQVIAAAVTVQNAPPTCASAAITIGPEPATIASVLSITVDGYSGCADADGDALTETFAWTVDGVPAGSGATLSAAFVRGQAVQLTTAWSDGYTSAASAVSNVVTVVNQAPVVASVVLSPTTPVTTDVLSAEVMSTDLEGDAVSLAWAWSVDGVPVSTDPTLDGAWFSRDQVVSVSVTPDDGFDLGAAVGQSVVIANSPPGAPTLALSPEQIEDADAIVCSILTAAADADADPLAYSFTWLVDGVAYTGTTESAVWAGDTVPADATSTGQSWTCQVSASDGTDVGPVAEITTVVGCDRDLDGYFDTTCGGDDCDDTNAARNPGASEVCDAADVDEDCDALADDADPSLVATTYYRDADRDGYGVDTTTDVACARPTGYATVAGDCNDASSSVSPGRTEVCDSADVDEDCDGVADDADASVTGQVNQWPDADGDRYGDSAGTAVRLCAGAAGYASSAGDCDEGDATVNPGAEEVCNDGIDNDCDPDSGVCGINGSLASGDAGWSATPGSGGSSFAYSLAVVDLDADTHPEVLVGDVNLDRIAAFQGPLGEGAAAETLTDASADAWFRGIDGLGYQLAAVGDVDGDGFDDALTQAYTSSEMFLLSGAPTLADVTFAAGDAVVTLGLWANVTPAGDFDGDGFDDFFLGTMRTTFAAELYRGGASGPTLATSWGPSGYWLGGSGQGGRDWDGDGLDDVVLSQSESAASTVYTAVLIAGDTSPIGTDVTTTDAWVTGIDYARVSAPGDVDGDGYEDLAVANSLTERLEIFLGPPTTGLAFGGGWANATGVYATPGDTDDDGVDELFVAATSWVYRYEMPLSSGTLSGELGSVLYGSSYEDFSGPIAGVDLGGDGIGDLLLGNFGTGANAVRIYEGGSE